MKIAVQGCAHGCLDEIYASIEEIEKRHLMKVELLICCGDFQTVRNIDDLKTLNCPDKYKKTGSFYKYFSGEVKAPVLTIFIGGNHEAYNVLQELPYGGWVAPNIYYMGYSGVINIKGLRIAGLSGIYKPYNYSFGRFEILPYDENSKRSVYHVRNLDVFRLKQLTSNPPDIVITHDWPKGVTDYGDTYKLMTKKPHFRQEIEDNCFGSPPSQDIMKCLRPKYWFAGHMHVKYPSIIPHEDKTFTKFLGLGKCRSGTVCLQILDIPANEEEKDLNIYHDKFWLAILKSTNHLISTQKLRVHMPGPGYSGRYDFVPTEEEVQEVENIFEKNFVIDTSNFEKTTDKCFSSEYYVRRDLEQTPMPASPKISQQTKGLCKKLDIDDPICLILKDKNYLTSVQTELWESHDNTTYTSFNDEEIPLSDEEETKEEKIACTKLSLPDPINVDDKELILSDVNDSFVIDNNPSNIVVDESPSPKKKMFKRRNESIYKSRDE